jgi:hypothetical protein
MKGFQYMQSSPLGMKEKKSQEPDLHDLYTVCHPPKSGCTPDASTSLFVVV